MAGLQTSLQAEENLELRWDCHLETSLLSGRRTAAWAFWHHRRIVIHEMERRDCESMAAESYAQASDGDSMAAESHSLASDPTTELDAYHHEPFGDSQNQIRILKLHPAPSFEVPIHGELHIQAVPAEPDGDTFGDYHAISYTWGDTSLTHEAYIDGRRLPITKNLDVALRHFREILRSPSLWIDGICIDQSNDEEKSDQVRMLRRTFNYSKKVYIWLGPGDADTDDAMRCLNTLAELRGERSDIKDVRDLPDLHREKLDRGCDAIFARLWWTRVWTMVELRFSLHDHAFVCGEYCATGLADAPHAPFVVFVTFANEGNKSALTHKLDDLLSYVSFCEATDPRDHIFALAGLIPETMQQLGFPDYSLSVSEVYQRTTLKLLFATEQSNPGNPYARGGRGPLTQQIPSWCIDFSSADWNQDVREQYTDANAASGPLNSFEWAHDSDKGLLMLQGVEVDTIGSTLKLSSAKDAIFKLHENDDNLVTRHDDWGNVLQVWIESLLLFRQKTFQSLESRVGKERAMQVFATGAFWRSLAGGWDLEEWSGRSEELSSMFIGWVVRRRSPDAGKNPDGSPRRYVDYAMLEHHFAEPIILAEATYGDQAADTVRRLSEHNLFGALTSFVLVCENSKLFLTTTQGYLGRCPDQAIEGDVVALLSRSKYPVVLSPHADGTYEHIAQAYVHGIMEGEFVQDLDAVQVRQFWLR